MMGPLLLMMAAAPVLPATPPPVLIMVQTEGGPGFASTQEELRSELTLLLDHFMVLATPVDVPNFARLPLAEQLAAVLPVTRDNDAVAAVWLSQPLKGQLMLHLVAMGTGRTLVRTVEFDRRSQSAPALALMLRELLGTAFLFEPVQAVPEVKAVVEEVRKAAAPPPVAMSPPEPAPPPPPRAARWELGLGGLIESGLFGGAGPSSRFGGVLDGSVRLGAWRLGLVVGVATQKATPSPTVALSATSLQPGVVGRWSFRLAGLEWGPVLGAGIELTWVDSANTVPQRLVTASFLGQGGLEVGGGVGPVGIRVRGMLLVRPTRTQVLESEYEPLPTWALPTLGLQTTLSLSWEGL